MSVRPRGTDSARLISVIETKSIRGTGESEADMCRLVTQYWSLDGKLLAEKDTCDDLGKESSHGL